MSTNDPSVNELIPSETPSPSLLKRREFLKRAGLGTGAAAASALVSACGGGGGSSDVAPPANPTTERNAPVGKKSANAWKFAVMADTQWVGTDDGQNPNTCAVGLINQLQQEFVDHGVQFAIQVGDLADQAYSGKDYTVKKKDGSTYVTSSEVAEDTRALFAQALYDKGIGFFACRGNHDTAVAEEFRQIFPQTQSGQMNATPDRVYAISNPDADLQPSPKKSGKTFTMGERFAEIGSPSASLRGLSYGFEFKNARFVLIDQYADFDGVLNPLTEGKAIMRTTVKKQLGWISQTLSGREKNKHAFVFAHKGLITQDHIDVLFGDTPADVDYTYTDSNTGLPKTQTGSFGLNDFIRSMDANKARLFFCGHDHIHNRSIVRTTDAGTPAQVTHVLCQSVSSKFYTPNEFNSSGQGPVKPGTSNDAFYCGGKRQVQLSQELYTVGYYIVTVDGDNVTVDYHSAPAYPTYESPSVNTIKETPRMSFTKRESFGYSLKGKQFLVGNGDTLTVVEDTGPSGSKAKMLISTEI